MEGDDKSRRVQMEREKELEFAVHKRDEVIQQLSAQLQHLTAHNYSQEATQLAQQVQILQTQLQHAGKVLQSQSEKQAETSHALQDATQEIMSLNEVIVEKDSMMTQLAEKLDLISQEYTRLKESHESTKLREKQTNELVQKLMIDAEQMRKQKSDVSNSNSISGPSSPTSPTPVVSSGMVSEIEVDAKMEAQRSELEETYGLHFAQMKQAVVQQYEEEKVTLNAEIVQLKAALEKASRDNAEYQQQFQHYVNIDSKFGQLQEECNLYKSQCDQLKGLKEEIQAQNEDYCQRLKDYEHIAANLKELQDECDLYKSQNDELNNRINSQQDSVVSLQSELDTLTSENIRLRDQMNLLSQDLDSQNSEIEEAFLEKSQCIEKAKKLEEEVGMLKSENEEFKSNSFKTEDMILSLKEALKQSETSRQKLEATIMGERDLVSGIKIDGVTSCESTDEADFGKLTEEPISDIDNVSLEVQTPIGSMPAESGTEEVGVKFYGQSTVCVQGEVTLQNASLTDIDQIYNDTSVSSIPFEEKLSSDTPNDSEATLTNNSFESSQSNSEQNQQYISQIEALKADVARLLDERTFALSEVEKLSDEILVLKDIGNKAEVELRELDHVKSENELFQREREEQLESNLTLMADVQSAHFIIENLEKERIQLLVNNESLEEKNNEIHAKYEDLSATNQRLSAELTSLGQDQSALVLSQTGARQETVSRTDEAHLNEGDSSVHSSHTDSDNVSRVSTCHSSLDQGQIPRLDNNHLAQFDGSFYFGKKEEVLLETHEQSADQSHLSASQANSQTNNADMGPNKTKKDNYKNQRDLEQEILQMQTHVDDLHAMRANLQEHIEHLRKEAKSLEKSLQQTQDQQTAAESVTTTERITDSANTTVNELMEKNNTLQEEKDLLNRKVSALEWQVTELQTENKKNTERLAVPVEEVMVQNFIEGEEAVFVGSIDPWTKPTAESLSSQDSIEQEIMVQDSQHSMFLGQEVVEDKVNQTGFQGTCEMMISSRMSPDSIDQLDNEDHANDISSDSIEQDVSRPETRLQERLESLKQEYEAQLDHLREQLATERQKQQGKETDQQHVATTSYIETADQFRQGLGSDQQVELNHVIQAIEVMHKKEVELAQRQHVDDVNLQVKAMRLTLEQIYTSQLELVRADMENQHTKSLDSLRETLTKEYKAEINRLEADWSSQMAELEDEHVDELQRSLLEEAVGSEQSRAAYIQNLNEKLSNEHRKLVEKISEDLEKGAEIRRHTPRKKQKPLTTESEDGDTETESIHSMPVTGEEYQQVEEREKVLDRVEDVRQTLEAQREEIVTLRAAMLTEYEQLLALRTETMASNTQQVEKMQHDMEDLQKTYEEKILDFQAKVESKTGEALRLTVTEQHNKELEILQSVYEQKLVDLQESFTKERLQHQQQIDHLMSLKQEVSSEHAQQEGEPTVTSSDEHLRSDKEFSNLSSLERVSELESKLAEKDSAIESLTSQITEIKERYEKRDTGLSDIQQELNNRCKELEEMKQILKVKDDKIVDLEKEKCDVEEKCAKDMQESTVRYTKETDEMTSRLIDIQAELEASREQERMLEEQYEELQHQHVQALESAHQDFDHEKHVEVGSLQSEFKVQLEIELKRQAADLAFDHEEKMKEIAKSYEDKIQQLKEDFDEKLIDIKTRASEASPDVEDKDLDTEKGSVVSQEIQFDTVDYNVDTDAASSKASTVVEVSSDRIRSQRQESDNSMESDRESETCTPRGGQISIGEASAMSYETEDESISQDITPGSDEAESIQDTTQDTTQDTDSETVAGLFKEISKAKEDTLSFLRAEYEQKIAALDDRLRQVMAENSEYEKDMEALKEQIEDFKLEKSSMEQKLSEMKTNYENKLKDIELSSVTNGDVDKVRQEYAREYDENVSQIRREFEEKMDLLRLELQESFENEKDGLIQEHRNKMNEIEDKYENLIESVRSGDAPEVADIVRDRIDTELEMAKTLMQQEFDETLESEQARMIELQQQELDDLQSQHESDIADCRKTLQAEFDGRLLELEQLHLEEMSKLQQELINSSSESAPAESKQEAPDSVSAEVDNTHADLVAQEMESLNEKHKNDLASLESHYDAKIKELEDKYSGEINELISRLDGHLTINTGTMELAGVVSPVLSVPRLPLDILDQKEGMERQGSSGEDSVPNRSTPRDLDSERSIDRSETMETLLPPAQISPTLEALSDRDHDSLKSEEIIMRFDSESEDNGMEERPGARMGHVPLDSGDFSSEEETIDSPRVTAAPLEEELIIPHLASAQSMLPGQTTSPEESKEQQMEEKEQDESEADRSTSPADILLQTQSLAGFTLPTSTIESSTGSHSADFHETLLMEVKEKDQKILQLEEEIQALNGQLKKQKEEENMILLRREREAQEDQNLEELLRQDVSRVNKEREAIQQTNEHLMQLLSDAVKTFMSVEESIGKKLSKIVVDTGDQSAHSGAKSPRSAEQSHGGPLGAEGGEFHDSGDVPQETSILSNDEGLDLSQRLCESIFLDSEGEELLTDASQRLQGSVTRLLDMIEDTTHQLTDARQTQHDLVSTLSSGQQESQTLESRCQEMEDRLREQVEAKEFLALELHKAEGLIEGYSAEREMLELRIQDLEEQKEALVLDLETTRNKLGDLETVHHEATSLRAEIQRQHNLVQENAGEEAQALMLEVHRVNEEKRDLAQKLRDLQEKYDHRVRDLENAGEETERHYVALLEDKKAEMTDLRLQLDASEKQNKANRQFMEEEAMEREKEREEYQREIASWEQKILDSQKEKKVETRLQRQVDDLTEQLQSRLDRDSEFVEQTAQLQRDLHDKQLSAEDMRALVLDQEKELEERGRMEDILRQKLREMEEELSKQHTVNTELSEIIKLPPNVESDEEEMAETSTSNGGHKIITGHRRLLPSQLSLQQEEELLHEKEALQRRVEQQLKADLSIGK
ncbi:nucleoprotein TPR-like isoform X2 [Pecten maximus]|uniref:nucleoprotein TPR-like isoform X2 n=1 Tax=Pecten maximus TaxID=6579 RepID=UPI00145857CA|nr:nucleoprotein TPR-like isoform X2 [Pecten maximus]